MSARRLSPPLRNIDEVVAYLRHAFEHQRRRDITAMLEDDVDPDEIARFEDAHDAYLREFRDSAPDQIARVLERAGVTFPPPPDDGDEQ